VGRSLRVADLYLWIGTKYPPGRSVIDAVTDGDYDPEEAARTAQKAVSIYDPAVAPDLAISAGGSALKNSPYSPADIGRLFYATVNRSPIDIWHAATYVSRVLGCHRARPLMMSGGCGIALVAIEDACEWARRDAGSAVLLTVADCWPTPFMRWKQKGLVFGDGGAAVVVGQEPGPCRIMSTTSHTDHALEGLFGAAWHSGNVDVEERHRHFFENVMSAEAVKNKFRDGLLTVVNSALSDADMSLDDIDYFAFPGVGIEMLEWRYLNPLGLALNDVDRCSWSFTSRVGHGSTEAFGGLDFLIQQGATGNVLLIAEGAGWQWGASVVHVSRER
jgi:3-oxoacyl-[acyl-carrier-protein] synthase-3